MQGMCGRYSAWIEIEALARSLGATVAFEGYEKTSNLAPTMLAPIVVGRPSRRIGLARFGYTLRGRPRDGGKPPFMVNARSETAAKSPAFREAMSRRRCIVPAEGYYEWRTEKGKKMPYLFTSRDGAPLLMLGIYEVGASPDPSHREPSFVVLTQPASGLAAQIHDRMPVVVPASQVDAWLDPENTDAAGLIRDALACSVAADRGFPVDRAVSSPSSQGAGLRTPTGPDLENRTA